MARRKNMNESALIAIAVIVGLPPWIISKITDSIGTGAFIVCIVVVLAAIIFYFIKKRASRFAYLRAKYVDEVSSNKLWTGSYGRDKLWSNYRTREAVQSRSILIYSRLGSAKCGSINHAVKDAIVCWSRLMMTW